ncbi:hypothetical protein AB0L57_13325 [Nocardia sp. NPDC052254]|uniref:hypothetical protein n=1 Tax=Nocardia sp. NPDC052254 TaxID=3155681 RepID=UPI003434979E
MPWLFIVIGALMVLFAAVVSPRKWWRTTSAWRYRDPDANEPSSAGFAAWQAGTAVAGVVLVGLGVWLNVSTSGSISGKPVTRPAVDLVAQKLGTSAEVLVSLDRNGQPNMARFDLHKFLDERIYHHMTEVNHQDYRAAHLALDSSSQGNGAHLFTVEAAGGVRYCLTVRTTGDPALAGKPSYSGGRPIMDAVVVPVSTAVTDGACT